MLLIGEVGDRREFGGVHGADERFRGEARGLAVGGGDFRQPLLAQAPDARADDGVRDEALLDPVDGELRGLAHERDSFCRRVILMRRTPSSSSLPSTMAPALARACR